MATVALEGTGTRIYFSDSHVGADLISLSIDERAREIIETTHLGTKKAKTYKPVATDARGRVTVVLDHAPEGVILTGRPPQLVTIEYPSDPGQEAVRISFAAAAVAQGKEEMRMDQRMVTEIALVVVGLEELPGFHVVPEPNVSACESYTRYDIGPGQVGAIYRYSGDATLVAVQFRYKIDGGAEQTASAVIVDRDRKLCFADGSSLDGPLGVWSFSFQSKSYIEIVGVIITTAVGLDETTVTLDKVADCTNGLTQILEYPAASDLCGPGPSGSIKLKAQACLPPCSDPAGPFAATQNLGGVGWTYSATWYGTAACIYTPADKTYTGQVTLNNVDLFTSGGVTFPCDWATLAFDAVCSEHLTANWSLPCGGDINEVTVNITISKAPGGNMKANGTIVGNFQKLKSSCVNSNIPSRSEWTYIGFRLKCGWLLRIGIRAYMSAVSGIANCNVYPTSVGETAGWSVFAYLVRP